MSSLGRYIKKKLLDFFNGIKKKILFLLPQCISPSYQPLYCAGGVCGLVLRNADVDYCPEPCSTFKQCNTCLKHSHCGWCSLDSTNATGQGICTEGSLEAPPGFDHPAGGTCEMLYYHQYPKTDFRKC